MKQSLTNWIRVKIKKGVVRFNIFHGKYYIPLALSIGSMVVVYAVMLSLLITDKFLLFRAETPMTLLPDVIIEELAKVFGIYFLISTRKNVSGLSVILIPAVFEVVELVGYGLWQIIIPFHIITGIIYLRFLRISKRMLFVAFVINSLLHWAWNIQTIFVESFSNSTIIMVFFVWMTLAIYAFKTLVNKTGVGKRAGSWISLGLEKDSKTRVW